MLHVKTRKREFIDRLHALNISISYDQVRGLSSDMQMQFVNTSKKRTQYALPLLKTNVFTAAAADNIDHNTSSTTAIISFHGISNALMQHPTDGCSVKEDACGDKQPFQPLYMCFLTTQIGAGLSAEKGRCNHDGQAFIVVWKCKNTEKTENKATRKSLSFTEHNSLSNQRLIDGTQRVLSCSFVVF